MLRCEDFILRNTKSKQLVNIICFIESSHLSFHPSVLMSGTILNIYSSFYLKQEVQETHVHDNYITHRIKLTCDKIVFIFFHTYTSFLEGFIARDNLRVSQTYDTPTKQ